MFRKEVLLVLCLFFLSACAQTLVVRRESCASFFTGKKVAVLNGEQVLQHTRDYFKAELINVHAEIFGADKAEYLVFVGSNFEEIGYITAWVHVWVIDRLSTKEILNVKREASIYAIAYSHFQAWALGYAYDNIAARKKNALAFALAQARNDLICGWIRP